jgi:hypothetical protein
MKLLTKPSATTETITIGGEQEVACLKMDLLLGFIPIFRESTKKIHTPRRQFAGRTSTNPVEVDFEDAEDPISICLTIEDDYYRKCKSPFELELDGVVYVLHGLFPTHRIRDNVWSCSFDYCGPNK